MNDVIILGQFSTYLFLHRVTSRFRMTTNIDQGFATNQKFQQQKMTKQNCAGTRNVDNKCRPKIYVLLHKTSLRRTHRGHASDAWPCKKHTTLEGNIWEIGNWVLTKK